MIKTKLEVEGDRELIKLIETAPQQFKVKFLKRGALSLTRTYPKILVETLLQKYRKRGKWPAQNINQWQVRTEKKEDGFRMKTRMMDKHTSEYIYYLNKPVGPYPVRVNLNNLRSWMKRHGQDTSWDEVRKYGEKIAKTGHDIYTGVGYIETSLILLTMEYANNFKIDFDVAFNESF